MSAGKAWEDFKSNFPWKDLVVGFLVPKAILFAGISARMVLPGAVAATAWSVAVVCVTRVKTGRASIFAILAMISIAARVAAILTTGSGAFYIYAQAVESGLYGAAFLLSLLLPRSLIHIFAEESGAKIPEKVMASAYYRSAWQIITAVWGVTYIAVAAMLVAFRMVSLRWAAAIDVLSNWPVTIGLILFTVAFPRRYWTEKLGTI